MNGNPTLYDNVRIGKRYLVGHGNGRMFVGTCIDKGIATANLRSGEKRLSATFDIDSDGGYLLYFGEFSAIETTDPCARYPKV